MVAKPADDDLDAILARAEETSEERLHPILTNEQVLEARAKARKAIEAQRVAAAMKAEEAKETDRLRNEEGFTSGVDYLDELVSITIDLPRSAPYIMVNGPRGSIYWHGVTYPAVPRHVANSLSETMFRLRRAEEQADGKTTDEMLYKPRNSVINGRTGVIVH